MIIPTVIPFGTAAGILVSGIIDTDTDKKLTVAGENILADSRLLFYQEVV